jgi:hypothetical protein
VGLAGTLGRAATGVGVGCDTTGGLGDDGNAIGAGTMTEEDELRLVLGCAVDVVIVRGAGVGLTGTLGRDTTGAGAGCETIGGLGDDGNAIGAGTMTEEDELGLVLGCAVDDVIVRGAGVGLTGTLGRDTTGAGVGAGFVGDGGHGSTRFGEGCAGGAGARTCGAS